MRIFYFPSVPKDYEVFERCNAGLVNEWVNPIGYTDELRPDDFTLTAEGFGYIPGLACRQATVFAESYLYTGDRFAGSADDPWTLRFHFHPDYSRRQGFAEALHIAWEGRELSACAEYARRPKTTLFGMALAKKPGGPDEIRTRAVLDCSARSFKYWGRGWNREDKNYQGEMYGAPGWMWDRFAAARGLLSQCAFVLAFENVSDTQWSRNYITEKIFHGFLSGGVPIYLGACNVTDWIPGDLFVDARKFDSLEAVLNHCENMPANEYDGYRERIAEWLPKGGRKFSVETRLQEFDQVLGSWPL